MRQGKVRGFCRAALEMSKEMDKINKYLWLLGAAPWGVRGGGRRAGLGHAGTDLRARVLAGSDHTRTGMAVFPGGWSRCLGAPGTGQNVQVATLPKHFFWHPRSSAFGAMTGPWREELAVSSYKIRKASDVWKESQTRRSWHLPVRALLAAKHKGVQWQKDNWTTGRSGKDLGKQRLVTDHYIAPVITNLRYINIVEFLSSISAVIL